MTEVGNLISATETENQSEEANQKKGSQGKTIRLD